MGISTLWPGETSLSAAFQAAEAEALGLTTIDPLARLLDDEFNDVLWDYDDSRVEPQVPGNLHPKQEEALSATERHRFLFWGNQSGKTSMGCVDDALFALGRHPVWSREHKPPVKIWVSALTWDLWEKILLPELLTWIPDDRIIEAPPPHARSTNRRIVIRADNGSQSVIEGKSAEQGAEKYQSARVHRIHFDEEHPKAIWDEAQPRLVRFGGHTLTTATPLKGLTWLYHDIYRPWKQGRRDEVFCSHAGLADNPSIPRSEIHRLEREYDNDPSQAAARLHGLFVRPQGLAIRYDPKRHFESWKEDALIQVLDEQQWDQFCGVDFGYWRFAFMHLAADRAKRVHTIGEVFSQRESLRARAEAMHTHLTRYNAPPDTRIWGDAANPTDIAEINKELKRLGSPYRVAPVGRENKMRRASVTRINNLLSRDALLIRRNLAEYQSWRLGQSASSDGQPMMGSRLLWEIDNWRYPKPRQIREETEAQKQDPDDNTADGADCIAAWRYAIMSWWAGAQFDVPEKPRDRNKDYGLEKVMERIQTMQNGGPRSRRY